MPSDTTVTSLAVLLPRDAGYFLDWEWSSNAVTEISAPLNTNPEARAWPHVPNPQAGMHELRWFELHRDLLTNYAGSWIAILGSEIVASGPTLDEVHRLLLGQHLRDALVVHVPEELPGREYFIG
jgi:hypothetical protein